MFRQRTLLYGSEFKSKLGLDTHCHLFAQFLPDTRIPRLQGGQECSISALAQLTSTTTRQVWARPPIDVDFQVCIKSLCKEQTRFCSAFVASLILHLQVLMFTASGLIVRFLKVFEKSNYQSIKWVRYLTKANGGYQVRVSLAFSSSSTISFVIFS